MSEELGKFNTGDDAAYRLCMHPGGKKLVLGMAKGGVRVLDVVSGAAPEDVPELVPAPEDSSPRATEIGELKSLGFDASGSRLALGYEDGHVEVREFPSLELVVRFKASPLDKAIRNLEFSRPHGDAVLLTTDEAGKAALWDAATGAKVQDLEPPASLPRCGFFKISAAYDRTARVARPGGGVAPAVAIYGAARSLGKGYLLRYRQDASGALVLDERSAKKPILDAPICGMALAPSGQFVALVTPEGDQMVVAAASLKPCTYRPKAHMTFATAVAFAPSERGVVSVSADASAVVAPISPVMAGEANGKIFLVVAALVFLLAFLIKNKDRLL